MLATAISIRRVAALNRDYEANFRSHVDCLPIFLQVGTTSLRDCSVDLRGTLPQPSITIFPLLIETERHPLVVSGRYHTCQPYRISRENPGKLTSIPVYRGIYEIYRIFKKSNIPPQAAIVHVRSTLNHVLTRYYHE